MFYGCDIHVYKRQERLERQGRQIRHNWSLWVSSFGPRWTHTQMFSVGMLYKSSFYTLGNMLVHLLSQNSTTCICSRRCLWFHQAHGGAFQKRPRSGSPLGSADNACHGADRVGQKVTHRISIENPVIFLNKTACADSRSYITPIQTKKETIWLCRLLTSSSLIN